MPVWAIVVGLVLVQATGILSTVGSAITGLDQTITGVVDLKRIFNKPKLVQPIVIPGQVQKIVIPPLKAKP